MIDALRKIYYLLRLTKEGDEKKKLSKKRKIIAIVLVIAILLYIAYAIYLLIIKTNDIYIVQQGTLSKEEEVVGYIIRDEVVIKENSEN